MPLQEWESDQPDIRKLVPADLCNPDQCISGLGWDTESYSTLVPFAKHEKYATLEPTQRHILAAASSMFDVDGRLTPTKINLQLLLQESWAIEQFVARGGWSRVRRESHRSQEDCYLNCLNCLNIELNIFDNLFCPPGIMSKISFSHFIMDDNYRASCIHVCI